MSTNLPEAEPVVCAPQPAPSLTRSGPLAGLFPAESRRRRAFYLVLAIFLTAWFFLLCQAYLVPVHPGVDQNGYLVGGKMFALSGTTKQVPINPVTGQLDPYLLVGKMWVGADLGTPQERYYPKYPIGLPVLMAAVMRATGDTTPVFWISPVTMTLGVLGTFFLARYLIGSFMGFLAAALVASSPVTLTLANNPNSHASTFFFVTWGMYFLLRWWQIRGFCNAILGGFFLGFAVTIRYTEGLLLLTMALVILMGRPWRQRRALVESAAMLAAWAVPVGYLVVFNLIAMGALTGYDPTNESTGFRWEYFLDNWDTMLRHLASNGLFLFFPLAIAGMLCMFWWRWRPALVLTSWIVPNILVYTAYYWAPDGFGVGYLRFFLTILPALAVCGVWLLSRVVPVTAEPDAPPPSRWRTMATPLIAGLLTGPAVLVNLTIGLPSLQYEYYNQLFFQFSVNETLRHVPPRSVLFSQAHLMHHLQFVTDYMFYEAEPLNKRNVERMAEVKMDEPQGLQPQRAKLLYDRLRDMEPKQLAAEQQKLINTALEGNRRVFFLLPGKAVDLAKRIAPAHLYNTQLVSTWGNLMTEVPIPAGEPKPRGRRQTLFRPPGRPTLWQLVEVTAKPPPPPKQATTKPAAPPAPRKAPPTATQPATQPATIRPAAAP